MKVAIGIQARIGSTRLPKKVLKKIYKDYSLFHSIYNQVKHVNFSHQVLLNTSDSSTEKELVEHAESLGLRAVTGPVDDIITRLYNMVEATGADFLIRIWGDCPFVCPDIINDMMKTMLQMQWQFISNGDFYSRTLPPGLDVEIYTASLLKKMNQDVKDVKQREFPVEYVRKNVAAGSFGFWNIKENYSDIHLTIDYPQDFVAGTRLLEILLKDKDYFISSDIYKLIEQKSEAIQSFSSEARNKEYVEYLKTNEDKNGR